MSEPTAKIIRRVDKKNYWVCFKEDDERVAWRKVPNVFNVAFADSDDVHTDLVFSTPDKGFLAPSVICYFEVP